MPAPEPAVVPPGAGTDHPAAGGPPTRTQRSPGSRLAAVLVPLLVLGGTGGMLIADLPAGAGPGGAAARFLPADGAVAVLTGDDGTTVLESSRSVGPGVLLQVPAGATDAAWERLGDAVTTTHFWRSIARDLDGEQPEVLSLFVVDDAGLALLSETGREVGFGYSPALLVLPADVADGSTWSQTGEALPGGVLEYEQTARADDAGDGCLDVTRDIDYRRAGEPVLVSVRTRDTWCPGRGIVATVLDAASADEQQHVELSAVSDDRAAELLAAAAETVTPVVADASAAETWAARDLVFRTLDPVFGETVLPGTSDAVAVGTASGLVAVAVGSDVVAYRTDDDGVATRAWIAHPGGRVVALGAVGDVVLVATTTRAVAAYRSDGVRLWSRDAGDVVVAPPVGDGGDGVLIASVAGVVSRVDLTDGEELWSAAVGADVEVAPAVDGDVVVVADRDGKVHALDLADGTVLWTKDAAAPATVAAGGGSVVALTENGDIAGYATADGTLRWLAVTHGARSRVLMADGVAVTVTDEIVTAWDAVTGDPLWWDDRTVGGYAAGDRVVLLGAADLAVIEARSGLIVGAWPTLPLELGEVPTLVALPDRAWMLTSLLVGREVAP